ncbi:YrhB domain-containing protein [Saccharopolyspora sp. NPDC002686]|uniref:YrhB domain-containing protein n=1 Tax=Saccharopolyspora sp. NPDC002686 TaxID=3154541 RepID=UPI00332A6D2C
MIDPISTAATWLEHVYGGRVGVVGTAPIAEGEHSWLVGCGSREAAAEPMLACTIAVPKDGREPFPVSNSAPIDELLNLAPAQRPVVPGQEPWRWRVNARNCVVAIDAVLQGAGASALPWRPADERPAWWTRLLAEHFPDATTTTHQDWAAALNAIAAAGPGSCAVVWLRRRFRDAEVTGHLLYAKHVDGAVLVLDPQHGMPAELKDSEVHELTVAVFHREPASAEPISAPWQVAATDVGSAVAKATAWLNATYGGEVTLVSPAAEDELRRGWLFACTTETFKRTGDWRDQLLDSALVVPKRAEEEPFGLPNGDPWTFLERWDANEQNLPSPPNPGAAAWYRPTMQELGRVLGTSHHVDWAGVISEVATLPPGAAAVVWVRRKDRRGRETVGMLLPTANEGGRVRIADPQNPTAVPKLENSPFSLLLITYATHR